MTYFLSNLLIQKCLLDLLDMLHIWSRDPSHKINKVYFGLEEGCSTHFAKVILLVWNLWDHKFRSLGLRSFPTLYQILVLVSQLLIFHWANLALHMPFVMMVYSLIFASSLPLDQKNHWTKRIHLHRRKKCFCLRCRIDYFTQPVVRSMWDLKDWINHGQ